MSALLSQDFTNTILMKPPIAKANHHKNGHSETKAVPGNQFVKEQLKTKIPNSKKRKTESLLSAEIHLTTTSDEDAEYFPFFLV
jgi:hypothetical protein